MATISIGELLVQCLKAEGVELMAGIIDGAHIPIVAHTPKYGIRYINAHHEEAAVHVAEGYARVARRPGVVIGNPACGAGNMLAGVVSAHGEGHPIVAIAATRARRFGDPNRGGAWQAADTESMARPITKYAATIRQWERVPEMVRAAFRAAMTGRPGPSFLAIADELLREQVDADKLPPIYPAERYRVTHMGAGDADRIARAAELLANAKRPYIHAGQGAHWADAGEEVVALGEFLAAPMSSSIAARGVIPEDHPHFLHPYDGAVMARCEADVVLVVGSRLGEYDTWGMPPGWGDPTQQKTIQIDSDPMSIGVNRPVDLPIVADAKAALAALLKVVRAHAPSRTDASGLAKYRAKNADAMMSAMAYLGEAGATGVNPAQMITCIRQFFPPELGRRARRRQHGPEQRRILSDPEGEQLHILGEDGLSGHRPSLRHRRQAGDTGPARVRHQRRRCDGLQHHGTGNRRPGTDAHRGDRGGRRRLGHGEDSIPGTGPRRRRLGESRHQDRPRALRRRGPEHGMPRRIR